MKKTPKAKLIKKLEKECIQMWHDIVLKRDKKCVLCGSTKGLQCHHIYTKKSHYNVRFNPDNGVVLCSGCHFKLHYQSLPDLGIYLERTNGEGWTNNLRTIAKQIIKDKLGYLEWTKIYLENLRGNDLFFSGRNI